jgi:hypothetical protein
MASYVLTCRKNPNKQKVITPCKTTNIVYDASAKSRKHNLSLNVYIYRGPVILQDICGMFDNIHDAQSCHRSRQ